MQLLTAVPKYRTRIFGRVTGPNMVKSVLRGSVRQVTFAISKLLRVCVSNSDYKPRFVPLASDAAINRNDYHRYALCWWPKR